MRELIKNYLRVHRCDGVDSIREKTSSRLPSAAALAAGFLAVAVTPEADAYCCSQQESPMCKNTCGSS